MLRELQVFASLGGQRGLLQQPTVARRVAAVDMVAADPADRTEAERDRQSVVVDVRVRERFGQRLILGGAPGRESEAKRAARCSDETPFVVSSLMGDPRGAGTARLPAEPEAAMWRMPAPVR